MEVSNKLRERLRRFICNVLPQNAYEDTQHINTREDYIDMLLENLIRILQEDSNIGKYDTIQ